MKGQIKFSFSIPVNETSVHGNQIVNFHHGDIFVHGVSYAQASFDLEKAIWNDMDILPLLEQISPDAMEFIKAASVNHIKDLFIIHQNTES